MKTILKLRRKLLRAQKYSIFRLIYNIQAILFQRQSLMPTYKVDPNIDNIILSIINDTPPSITIGEFNIRLKHQHYTLRVWNRNKYYAWMYHGTYTANNFSFAYTWRGARPSRYIMAAFETYLIILTQHLLSH